MIRDSSRSRRAGTLLKTKVEPSFSRVIGVFPGLVVPFLQTTHFMSLFSVEVRLPLVTIRLINCYDDGILILCVVRDDDLDRSYSARFQQYQAVRTTA